MGFDRMTDLRPWGMDAWEKPASSSKEKDKAKWV